MGSVRPLLKREQFQSISPNSPSEDLVPQLVRFQFQLNSGGKSPAAQIDQLNDFLRLSEDWRTELRARGQGRAFEKWTQSTNVSRILEVSFNCRRLVHDRLAEVCGGEHQVPCVDELAILTRRTTRRLREIADEVLLLFLSADPGYLLASTSRTSRIFCGSALEVQSLAAGKIKIRSGDVLLSRAGAFISAGIARASEEASAYSHVAMIFIDSDETAEVDLEQAFVDPRVCVVEADMRVGARVRPFKEYANERFARVALLRTKCHPSTAHEAARHAAALVKTYATEKMKRAGRSKVSVNDNIPYDFSLNLKDSSTLFCSQLLQIAFRSVHVPLPRFPSKIRENCLSKFAGMKDLTTFVPTDCEVDPELSLLAEWRDLSQLNDVCLKDAAFDVIYQEMAEGRLKIEIAGLDRLLAYSKWVIRKFDLGFNHFFPKHVRPESLALSFAVNRLGSRILRDHLREKAGQEEAC